MVHFRIFVRNFRKWPHTWQYRTARHSEKVGIHAAECKIPSQSRFLSLTEIFTQAGRERQDGAPRKVVCCIIFDVKTRRQPSVCFQKIIGNQWYCQGWSYISRKVRRFYHLHFGMVPHLLNTTRWCKVSMASYFYFTILCRTPLSRLCKQRYIRYYYHYSLVITSGTGNCSISKLSSFTSHLMPFRRTVLQMSIS